VSREPNWRIVRPCADRVHIWFEGSDVVAAFNDEDFVRFADELFQAAIVVKVERQVDAELVAGRSTDG
jgi:hypothetical protein